MNSPSVPSRKGTHSLVHLKEVLLIVRVQEPLSTRDYAEGITRGHGLAQNDNIGLQRGLRIRVGEILAADQFRSAERKVDVVHDQGHLGKVLGAVVAFLLEGVKPAGVLLTRD